MTFHVILCDVDDTYPPDAYRNIFDLVLFPSNASNVCLFVTRTPDAMPLVKVPPLFCMSYKCFSSRIQSRQALLRIAFEASLCFSTSVIKSIYCRELLS